MYCIATDDAQGIDWSMQPAVDLASVLDHHPQAGLLKFELLLDNLERVATFGTNRSPGCYDQISQPSNRRLVQGAPIAWWHGNPEGCGHSLHFRALLNALVVDSGGHQLFLAMQQLN